MEKHPALSAKQTALRKELTGYKGTSNLGLHTNLLVTLMLSFDKLLFKDVRLINGLDLPGCFKNVQMDRGSKGA